MAEVQKPSKEDKEAAKAVKEAAAAKKKADKEAEKAAKMAAKESAKVEKVEQNGISRPKADSETGKVWLVCDNLSASLQRVPSREEVLTASAEVGVNPATTATQYARWRKFHGVTGTIPNPNKVVKEKPVKEPKKAKAVKEAAAAE